ncbi:hypothetical protein RhiirA1_455116, partial [Rhizophagus irregularis]
KIKILSSSLRYLQNNYLEFNLIENIKQNLNYLIIDVTIRYYDSIDDYIDNIDDCIELSSNILQNLGQILPFKLEYLELYLAINGSDLETFLKNSQNTFIKKMLIKNIKKEVTDEDIIPYIKEYIVKKKRVDYLAIIESIKFGRFYSLWYEMKGFELYGIQVLNYFDLSIDLFEFVQEL